MPNCEHPLCPNSWIEKNQAPDKKRCILREYWTYPEWLPEERQDAWDGLNDGCAVPLAPESVQSDTPIDAPDSA